MLKKLTYRDMAWLLFGMMVGCTASSKAGPLIDDLIAVLIA